MVTETKVSYEAVVFKNVFPQFLNTRFVLEVDVSFEKPSIELDDLT